MAARLVVKIALLLSILLLSACASQYVHEVSLDGIDRNKDKTFKIGIVKVKGSLPTFNGDNVGIKKAILEKVPTQKICDLLVASYGLKIDANINNTIKIVEEKKEGQGDSGPVESGLSIRVYAMEENPYWGAKVYQEPTGVSGWFSGGGPVIQDENVGDFIYITYGMRVSGMAWSVKNEFYYEVMAKSDAQVLVLHKGIVAVVDIARKSVFGDDQADWDNFAVYVDKIPEALGKDIQAKK